MSENQPERSTSDPSTYRTADEIVRSILDDHASSPSEISPSGELYRAIERFHANAHRRPGLVSSARRDLVRNHLNRWASASRSSSRNSMSSESNSNSETHRRYSREPLTTSPPGAPSLPPLRSLHAARRQTNMPASASSNPASRHGRSRTAERYPERNRPSGSTQAGGPHQQSDYMTQVMLLEQQRAARQRLHRADVAVDQRQSSDTNDQLRALLDFTHASSQAFSELSFPSPPLQPQEPIEDSRRAKRRKLDADRISSGLGGFRYGRYGQVEPGQLIMEMVSCDGGLYADDGQNYVAENILKNDSSVYCTKGPRCNIVLRHQGATVFTLKELVIKAPRSNYTSPVQEGMVFVAMDSDDLLARTAQYQIQYTPARSLSRRVERETQPLAPIVSIRHNEDGSMMTRAQVRARRLYNIGMDDEDNDYPRIAQLPSEFTLTPPPFRVTTECSDDEGDDATSRADWRAPNRIGSLPFESDSSSDEGNLDDFGLSGSDYQLRRRRNRSNMALSEAADPTLAGSQAFMPDAGGEMMTPLARFFIERDKSKCTIKFDPPVSGRFILLKMWNPHRDPTGNIDIQAVVAKGYAGPRYFPAVELR